MHLRTLPSLTRRRTGLSHPYYPDVASVTYGWYFWSYRWTSIGHRWRDLKIYQRKLPSSGRRGFRVSLCLSILFSGWLDFHCRASWNYETCLSTYCEHSSVCIVFACASVQVMLVSHYTLTYSVLLLIHHILISPFLQHYTFGTQFISYDRPHVRVQHGYPANCPPLLPLPRLWTVALRYSHYQYSFIQSFTLGCTISFLLVIMYFIISWQFNGCVIVLYSFFYRLTNTFILVFIIVYFFYRI